MKSILMLELLMIEIGLIFSLIRKRKPHGSSRVVLPACPCFVSVSEPKITWEGPFGIFPFFTTLIDCGTWRYGCCSSLYRLQSPPFPNIPLIGLRYLLKRKIKKLSQSRTKAWIFLRPKSLSYQWLECFFLQKAWGSGAALTIGWF